MLVHTGLVLAASLQSLAAQPSHAEVGQPVVVRARDAADRPLAGLVVDVHRPDGSAAAAGTAGADGTLAFGPPEAGPYRLSARHEGVELIAPLHASARPPRGWYAVVCVPVGLALAWCAARGRRITTPRR